MAMSQQDYIDQEIIRLGLVIASLRYDYEQLVLAGKPYCHRALVAEERCSYEFQRKCLVDRNFRALPYNIKLLYNQGRQS